MTEIFFSYSSTAASWYISCYFIAWNAHREQQQHWEFSQIGFLDLCVYVRVTHRDYSLFVHHRNLPWVHHRWRKDSQCQLWPNADKNPRRIDFLPSVCLHFGWVIALAAGNMSFHNFYIFMVIWLCVNIRARQKEKKNSWRRAIWIKKIIYLSVKCGSSERFRFRGAAFGPLPPSIAEIECNSP